MTDSEYKETMEKSILDDFDYELWRLLFTTRRTILKAFQKELNQYGISARHAGILLAVQAIGDKATPVQIARWLFRERSSVCEILDRMEKQGLVRKVRDLGRKNLVRVSLTEKGREASYYASKRESIHRVMCVLSEEERQQLRYYLQMLRDKGLEEIAKEQ